MIQIEGGQVIIRHVTRVGHFFIFLLFSMATQAQDNTLPNLHMAALQGDAGAIQKHVEAGSDLDVRDAYGSTALSVAVTFGHAEVAKKLIDNGADLNLTDPYGSSPLHLAALFGRSEIAKALIEAQADRYALTNNGATPYDIAATPFEHDTSLLRGLQAQLGPFGLQLDMAMVKLQRKKIAATLRPNSEVLEPIEIEPLQGAPWPVMSYVEPEFKKAVQELLYDAQHYSNIKSIIILKDDELVSEKYFNGQDPDRLTIVQSVTKSYFATLIGIAIEQGCISGLDAKMADFFPEYKTQFETTRKKDITIRHLLQMRAGYPWEELDQLSWNRFIEGIGQFAMIADYPLSNAPGEEFNYSNLSNYILGIIVARACDVDLKEFAIENLLDPIGSGHGEWYQDTLGYYYSLLSFTPRDVALLGQLYLNDGMVDDNRILTKEWCQESHENYSNDAWVLEKNNDHLGRYFYNLGYGYQWWSAEVAGQRIPFAWGHGGQMVFVLRDQGMVVSAISDPQWRQHNPEAWQAEQSSFNLIGKFLTQLLATQE